MNAFKPLIPSFELMNRGDARIQITKKGHQRKEKRRKEKKK
jgi:hypothetical protein